ERYGVGDARMSQILRRTDWTCYLSGKMRGLPDFGFSFFDAARDALAAQGWRVISPADLDRETGFSPESDPLSFNLATALKRDFDAIKNKADALVLLPNWRDSVGARA